MRNLSHLSFLSRPAVIVLTFFALHAPGAAAAQDAPDHFADAFLPKFTYSSQRLTALAEALPAETFSWSPGEGVMSVERVFMHIARYNYLYPVENMGAALPDGVDLDGMEDVTGKEAVIGALRASIAFTEGVVDDLTAQELAASTELYGQQTAKWDVLFQLQSHLSEHVGQLIAYARMNGIVPPWSR